MSSERTSSLAPSLELKFLFYASLLVMAASGITWLILDNFFQLQTAIGPQKHPWQSIVLSVHGFASYFFALLLGFMISQHVIQAWAAKRYRLSGNLIIAASSFLTVTGATFLFFSIGDYESIVTWIHVGAGLTLLISVAAHALTSNNRTSNNRSARK